MSRPLPSRICFSSISRLETARRRSQSITMLAEKFHSGKANFKLEFGDLTRLGRIEAKGLTHTSPGQRPGKKQRIFIEGQRPVSHLNFKILIMPMLQSLNQV